MPSPSRATRDALGAYCRSIADSLGLRDWTLILNYDEPALSEENARIDCVYGRRTATIHWGESFWTLSRSDQRNTVVHELIHIHLDAIASVVTDMGEQLGDYVHSVVQDNHHRAIEFATDGLATAVSGRFSLPPRLRLGS